MNFKHASTPATASISKAPSAKIVEQIRLAQAVGSMIAESHPQNEIILDVKRVSAVAKLSTASRRSIVTLTRSAVENWSFVKDFGKWKVSASEKGSLVLSRVSLPYIGKAFKAKPVVTTSPSDVEYASNLTRAMFDEHKRFGNKKLAHSTIYPFTFSVAGGLDEEPNKQRLSNILNVVYDTVSTTDFVEKYGQWEMRVGAGREADTCYFVAVK